MHLRRAPRLVPICLALIALADFLFYRRPLGWTAGLFTLALVTALATGDVRRVWRGGPGRLVLLAVLGLALMAVEEPGALVVVLSLLGVVSLAMIERGGWARGVPLWLERWLRFAAVGWLTPLRDFGALRKAKRRAGRPAAAQTPVRGAISAWSVPVGLALVFLSLFALANPVISRVMGDVRQAFADAWAKLPDFFSLPRAFFWLAVGAWAWALLRARVKAEQLRLEIQPPELHGMDR